MEPVDPLAVQVCQRRLVLSHGQRPGFEPPHLRARGRLRIDSTPAHNLAQFAKSNQTYGVPRMFEELPEEGVQAGKHRIARLMRDNGLKSLAETPLQENHGQRPQFTGRRQSAGAGLSM